MPVQIHSRQALLRVPRRRIRQAVEAAFRLRRRAVPLVSVAVVDDRGIRRLHRRYLGQDTSTDVLSFPLGDPYRPLPGEVVGEVVVSAETARRTARDLGHPPTFELTLYVVHGVLHLLGYDDHDPRDRKEMRAAERRCLAAAGIRQDLFSRSSAGKR